jgi:lipopolysaccharide export LptBFGC system permease protein LptF
LRRYGFLLDLMLLAGLLAALFISSSQPYYKQDMRGMIDKFIDNEAFEEKWQDISIRYGGKEISVEEAGAAGFIEFFIRKGTHFLTFAALALLYYRVLRRFGPFAAALPWSGFLSLFTALLDEWHQTFTPDRTGMLTDVLLDLTGICTMLLLIACLAKKA